MAEELKCENCGQGFIPTCHITRQKYCSNECRYRYDGSVYVFRDKAGLMLKYIEWDGQGFLQGKRRAQSGSYPWPKGQAGEVLEITEREFEYLLSKSIVPFKTKKGCDS